jgi:hypothetical protein
MVRSGKMRKGYFWQKGEGDMLSLIKNLNFSRKFVLKN